MHNFLHLRATGKIKIFPVCTEIKTFPWKFTLVLKELGLHNSNATDQALLKIVNFPKIVLNITHK